MQIDVRQAAADDWRAVRAVRLAALQESPDAFASTLERETAFVQDDWLRRLDGPGSTFLARPPDQASDPVGIIGGFPLEGTVELVSMWVAPPTRGSGVASALVDAVMHWARDVSPTVHLWVTETNQGARALYERCGFTYTDERQPLPSNPTLDEVRMARTTSVQ